MPLPPSTGILQNQPENINFLATHRFRVVLRRTPSVQYFLQQANLPGLSMDNASQPTPFVDLPIPGDKIRYEDFSMTFPVDEDLANYKEIASWMVGLGFPKTFDQYSTLDEAPDGIRSDIALLILDSKLNVQHIVNFRDAFPTSLSGIDFNVTDTDTVIPHAVATFKYSYWEFDEVNTTQ